MKEAFAGLSGVVGGRLDWEMHTDSQSDSPCYILYGRGRYPKECETIDKATKSGVVPPPSFRAVGTLHGHEDSFRMFVVESIECSL
jgi:hypothetical protein